jgi:type I restriction enzyme S subunit
MPNRALFTEIKERNRPEEQMLSVTITKGVVRQSALLEESSKKDSSNLDRSAYKLVQPGDIAYNKMRAWQGAIGASSFRGIVSPAYVVVRPRGASSSSAYFHELFRTPMFAKEAERWSYGITSDMWSLRSEHFRMIYVAVPPADEQSAIVRFLHHADARIRRYVGAKQKLIKLLEEQMHAIIHRAVTRGLDESVRFKPSGVEWLGNVPEHWEVSQLRRLVQPRRRLTYGILKPGEYDPSGRVMVRAQDFSFGWSTVDKMFRVSPAVEEPYARCRLRAGDLLFTVVGAGLGNVSVVPEWLDAANTSRANARISLDDTKVFPEFIELVLQGPLGRRQVEYYGKGSAQPVLNLEFLGAFTVLVPPVGEQQQILDATNVRTKAMRDAASRAHREIDLLRELRTRLIADLVTGKLDVRQAATQVPELDPAAVSLDELGEVSQDEKLAETHFEAEEVA